MFYVYIGYTKKLLTRGYEMSPNSLSLYPMRFVT